ncbi:24851_t:CDS:2, partial [Gigaspora margarita]
MQVRICKYSFTGAPCKHQALISFYYHIYGLNQTPVLFVNSRYYYVYLVLEKKHKELSFYIDLYQEKINQDKLLYLAEFAALNNNNSVNNAINEVISEAKSVYDNYSSNKKSRDNDSTGENTTKKLEQENQAQDTNKYENKEPTQYIMSAQSKRLQKKHLHNLNKALIESCPN